MTIDLADEDECGPDLGLLHLPHWNSLTKEQRCYLVKLMDFEVGGTDAEYWSGDIAVRFYAAVRRMIAVDLPPVHAAIAHEARQALKQETQS